MPAGAGMALGNGKNNAARKYKGGGARPDLRELRQREAAARQLERDDLTALGQIKKLDAMFGKGVGARKERARLSPG